MKKEQVLQQTIREEIQRLNEQSAADIEGVLSDYIQTGVPLEAKSGNAYALTFQGEQTGQSEAEASKVNERARSFLGTAEATMFNASDGAVGMGLEKKFDMDYRRAQDALRDLYTRDNKIGRSGVMDIYTGRFAGVDAIISGGNVGYGVFLNPSDANQAVSNAAEMLSSKFE